MKRLQLAPLSQPARAEVKVPGSKSYTNRALLLAAMTPRTVRVVNPLMSDDTLAMASCLKSLGIAIKESAHALEVTGDISAVKDRDYTLDANLSGTTMRFMAALCSVLPGRQTLRGGPGLHQRPIGDLVDGLTQLGAVIEYLGKPGYPPLLIKPPQPAAKPVVELSGERSSQYLSALLMVAPLIGDVTISIKGELISRPFVDMTLTTMRQFGLTVTDYAYSLYRVDGKQIPDCDEYTVEGDVSGASYFLAIAALTKSALTLTNLNPRSLQADMGFLRILKAMGNTVAYGEQTITMTGRGVKPVETNMNSCPDQAQTLAVLAAFADGATTISGIQSLRIKETERIKALQQELAKMEIKTEATPDSLTIHGGQPKAARIATYGDHRMAMAFAVAGAKLAGMEIEEPDVVAKTFPDFWKQLAAVGVKITEVNKP